MLSPKARRWLVLGAIALPLLLLPAVVRAYRVAGDSDAPRYRTGDLVFVNQAAYGLPNPFSGRTLIAWGVPSIGDEVVFEVPDREAIAFKRVVGRGGDTVEIRRGRLYRNGALAEPNDLSRARIGENFGPMAVPADHVFVLSADLLVGLDSRHFGPVPRRLVRGEIPLQLSTH